MCDTLVLPIFDKPDYDIFNDDGWPYRKNISDLDKQVFQHMWYHNLSMFCKHSWKLKKNFY